MTNNTHAPGDAARNLLEANALLTEGLDRIMGVASELPGASHPLQEALELSEQQAMATLEAVESALEELHRIRSVASGFIDEHLGRLDSHLQKILTSQQGQDLAGQRLKKAIALLQVVEARVQEALGHLGSVQEAPETPAAEREDTFTGTRLDQGTVDDLLAELGL